MVGVLVNVASVIIGSTLGLLFKKGISKKFSDAVMTGIGLCIIYIGFSGALDGENTLVAIISMIIGAIIGTALNIDKNINRLGDFLSSKIKKKDDESSISAGFVTASLLFCVGAMTIMGPLDAGLNADNTTLFTKSLLDFFSAIMLSASLGLGVMFAAVCVFVIEGSLVLVSSVLESILTTSAIAEITCVGSLLIFALGLNLIGVTKIKVANYLPSLLTVPFICALFELLEKYIPFLS